MLSFILEDFVETGLQYFYFEKYGFVKGDLVVYFNAGFMIFKALVLSIRIIIFMKVGWASSFQPYKESFRFSLIEAFMKYNLALNPFQL